MVLFHLKTFGCQMNVYDSSRIVDLLSENGMDLTEDETNADIIILNTCYIREKASAKIFSELGRLKKLYKDKNPVFAVIGCVAKAEGENIFKRAPFVSIVLSSQKYHLLPELLNKALIEKKIIKEEELQEKKKNKTKLSHLINTELSGLEKFDCLPKQKNSEKVAFVQVQEGCNKFCTYCVVPNTRGREISRDEQSILDEVENLQKVGAVEINLLGQNVDCYNGLDKDGNKSSLAKLIKKIAKFENVKRIRYTTSYPSEFSDEMIELHAIEPKLMPLVYLPIQAGSNEVLHKMNRRYTREQYLELIEKLKNANPNIQISSDFIVGFPNETEEDFQQTLDIVKRVKFIQCYAFKYSPRPNTVAQKMDGQIDLKIKSDRLKRLQVELRKSQDAFNKSCVGRVMSVLFTDVSKTDNQYIIGKNEYLQPVIVKADAKLVGTIQNVEIESASYANLKGKII
ncbi:MAG: tRNA (N6-isopentenyl adenosine(37)-C2)-methylthiotransferase MiaB [bacterium]|nr:tRNA (N6-isopentenyl adenosine(37)-C2)-methylthiotransferase MiaB [bacterium]